ncbi:MAG: 1-deoxy-D-xylulose-5-phosphate reductoisomerase [Candidatus Omnitrophota bacterium]|jgi:1-deoxy-D-xylulose-5-phosphate reductoisomerase
MKRIFILGSTGSIGTSALEVIKRHPAHFCLAGLGANSSIDSLRRQADIFRPAAVWIGDKNAAERFIRSRRSGSRGVFAGIGGFSDALTRSRADLVLVAVSGAAALPPLMEILGRGIDVALANKEALVMAGGLVMARCAKNKVRILPVDSEQSAIWQCLSCNPSERLERIYLTASGGPLRGMTEAQLRRVGLKDVLRHPRWKMGRKITVDSATLMNKGLEVIEAMHLFGASCEDIQVLVHPEAVVHSMVEFKDGAVMAQLSVPDMRIPIQYAFSYPRRIGNIAGRLDFFRLGSLNFEKPDLKKFLALGLAYAAAREAGTMPAVLNAANEVCVAAFMEGNIGFTDIPGIVARVMDAHKNTKSSSLEAVFAADLWARQKAAFLVRGRRK